MISMAPFPWERGNWECGRSAIHQLGGLTGELPAEERAAFLEMRAHELRGRELTAGELRRVAERAWRTFLEHRWQIHDPVDAA